MTSTVAQVNALFQLHGSDVRFFRSDSKVVCPCATPEGYRDPSWHIQRPTAPVCDPSGHLPDPAATVDVAVKGFVQPVTSARGAKLPPETIIEMFGLEVETDDHIAMFPVYWNGVFLNFYNWGRSVEDFVEYNNRRFTVVNANMIPDLDGNPEHHWEVGLRLVSGADIMPPTAELRLVK
jgi:hypothetical protein